MSITHDLWLLDLTGAISITMMIPQIVAIERDKERTVIKAACYREFLGLLYRV